MPKGKQKRKNIRLKKAIYKCLEEHYDGLTTKQIYAFVMDSPAKKFVNGSSQIGQILLRMPGITHEEQTVYSTQNSYSGAIWRLQYPEDMLDWLED